MKKLVKSDSGSEVGVFELVKSLNKKESLALRKLMFDDARQTKTELHLLDLIRDARKGDMDLIYERARKDYSRSTFYKAAENLGHYIDKLLCDKYRNTDSVDARLTSALSLSGAYWRKGFQEPAIAVLRKAIDNMRLEDYPDHVLTLLFSEQRMIRSASLLYREERFKNNQSQRQAALKILSNREQINDLSEEAFMLRKRYAQSDHEEVMQKVDALLSHPLLQNEVEALSFNALLRFHVTLSNCARLKSDFENHLNRQLRIVQIWEKRPDQQKLKPRTFQQAIINYLSSCVRQGKTEDFNKWIDRVQEIEVPDKAEEVAGFFGILSVRLFYFLNHGTTEDAVGFFDDATRQLKQNSRFILPNDMTSFYHNLAVLMFLTDNEDKAKEKFEEVIEMKGEVRNDITGASRVLLILLEFNRNNPGYLDSLNRASRRYFLLHPEIDSASSIMFKYIGKLLNQPLSQEMKILKEWDDELSRIREEKGDPAGTEEVQFWVQSKITGKPISQIWLEKRGEG